MQCQGDAANTPVVQLADGAEKLFDAGDAGVWA